MAGDSWRVVVVKAELARLLNKHDQALVVKAMIKRMPSEATNMAAEEHHNAADRYIASVTLPDGRLVTTNVGILEAFRSHFQDLFTREPGLRSARFGAYLVDFPRLETIEAAVCKGLTTEDEVWEALKQVGWSKAPGIDLLPYEMYLRQSPLFVPLLALVYNNLYKDESIPKYFTGAVFNLLLKSKSGGDGLSNFCPLSMLNTDLKGLAKILADRLQAVLSSLIGPEQTCAVKGRIIQDNLHLVRMIIEKVNSKAALINLDQFKLLIGLTIVFWNLFWIQRALGRFFSHLDLPLV